MAGRGGAAAPGWTRGPEHRLPLVARRVPGRDAPDRNDVRRRRGTVRRRRPPDQAAQDRSRLTASGDRRAAPRTHHVETLLPGWAACQVFTHGEQKRRDRGHSATSVALVAALTAPPRPRSSDAEPGPARRPAP